MGVEKKKSEVRDLHLLVEHSIIDLVALVLKQFLV